MKFANMSGNQLLMAAIYLAGAAERGILKWPIPKARISRELYERQLDESLASELVDLIAAFRGFAQDVRFAARNNSPIPPHGEDYVG